MDEALAFLENEIQAFENILAELDGNCILWLLQKGVVRVISISFQIIAKLSTLMNQFWLEVWQKIYAL